MEETRLVNEERKMKIKSQPIEEDVNDLCSDDQPPTAKYVYDIVFERVEEEPIDKVIGVTKDDPWFLCVEKNVETTYPTGSRRIKKSTPVRRKDN